ncbi:MAG: hypothetical protein Q9211_001666, partial [Gyalolechia sp. 1 TL-2023]
MYLHPAAALVALNATTIGIPPPFRQQAIICWDDRYATKPLAYSDCESVVAGRIAPGPYPSRPIYFSRDPVQGRLAYRVPKVWQSPPGSCK